MLTFNEPINDYEIFLKALSYAEDKEKFLSEKNHKILSPFNIKDNIFMKNTVLSKEKFLFLLSNPHSENLLNSVDEDGISCVERNNNDLNHFLKHDQGDFVEKFIEIISNFQPVNQRARIEDLIVKVINFKKKLREDVGDNYLLKMFNKIENLKINNNEINWTKVIDKIDPTYNRMIKNKQIRNKWLSVYPCEELKDWLCIYGSDLNFFQKIIEEKNDIEKIEIFKERFLKEKRYLLSTDKNKVIQDLITDKEKNLKVEKEKTIILNEINHINMSVKINKKRI